MSSNNPNPRGEVCYIDMNHHVKTRGAPDSARDPRIGVFPKGMQRFARGALRWRVKDRAGLRPWRSGLRQFISRSTGSLRTSAERPEKSVRLKIHNMYKEFQWDPTTPIREMTFVVST